MRPHTLTLLLGWEIESEAVAEAPPDSGVKQLFVVRSRDHNGLSSDGIQVLNEAVDDTFKLSKFLSVAPNLCDSIELVKKEDAGCSGCEIE